MSTLELVPWRKDRGQMSGEPADDWLMPLHHQIDRVFTDFLGADFPRLVRNRWDGGFCPSMDVSETDRQLKVTAELPGVDDKDIEVTLTDGVLTVKGEKRSESEEEDKDKHHYRLERSYGAFRRSFRLPPGIDADDVSASFDKGVLKVTVAKKEAAESATRKIEVSKGA